MKTGLIACLLALTLSGAVRAADTPATPRADTAPAIAAPAPAAPAPAARAAAAPAAAAPAPNASAPAAPALNASAANASAADAVLRATLPNGLRVVIVPDRLAPAVTTELSYLAGAIDVPAEFPGTAHALEHMMFRGSEGLDKDQFYELGARLGGQYNASTGDTATRYTFTVPASDLGLVLRIEALRMRAPLLAQEDWEQERGAIEQEVAGDLSQPIYDYYTRIRAALFDSTPYAHDGLGTRESFDRTDAAMLRDFYATWYVPNNAILVIAGDVNPAKALAEVKSQFGAIPSHPVPEHPPSDPRPVRASMLTLPTDFPVNIVSMAYRMPGMRSPDFAAADILGDVLSSQRGGLHALTVSGKALAATFSYRPDADVGLAFAYIAFPEGTDPARPRADLEAVLADVLHNGVPPDLVEAAKRRELASLAFRNNSIAGLASSWTNALAVLGANSPDDIAKAYEAVTVADVNRIARDMLNPDHAITTFLTPVHSGQPVSGGGFGAPETIGVPPNHPVALPDWAASALAAPPLPEPTDPPDVGVLPNGLKLIVKPEHVAHTVSVYGRIRQIAEMQEPRGKEGVSSVLAGMFEYGTETRDRLALRAAVDELAASETAGPSFHLQVLSSKWEAGMKLLAEHELHPALPLDGFNIVRGQLAQSLPGILRSPAHLFDRAREQALVPENDPAMREESTESVLGLTLDDARAFHAAAYRPDLTTIVVIGDITVAEAKRVVAETFGDWRAEGATPNIDLPSVGPNKASRAQITDPSSVQERIVLEENLTLPVTSPDRFPLALGNTILGGGFSSRLVQDMRVKTGTVYGVSSSLQWGRTRGQYQIAFGSDPDKAETARGVAIHDLTDIQTVLVSDAELTRAKAQLLRRLRTDDTSLAAIASRYLYRDSVGLPLANQQADAKRYLSLTAKDIQKAFVTWLRPGDLATIVKGPNAGE